VGPALRDVNAEDGCWGRLTATGNKRCRVQACLTDRMTPVYWGFTQAEFQATWPEPDLRMICGVRTGHKESTLA